jgi:hypothetical protein
MRIAIAAAFLASAAALAGCANKYETMTPELQASMMSDLRAGKLNLDCGIKCKLTWESQAPAVHALDIAERWPELAVRVMQIGYGSDLAYYYLGQSAQGLKYHDAAIGYYNYSLALASGADVLLRCEDPANNSCQGVDIAASIPVLVQASRDALAQEHAQDAAAEAPVHHHHHKAPVQKAGDWVTPPAPGTAAQGSTASSDSSSWATPPAKQ